MIFLRETVDFAARMCYNTLGVFYERMLNP